MTEVKKVIKSFCHFAAVPLPSNFEVNERGAEALGIMLNETMKCSKAFGWIPTPPGGRATIVWLATQLGRGIFNGYGSRLGFGFLLFGMFFNQCSPDSGPVLEEQPWPAEHKCETCVAVQFAKLEMHLPLSKIGKLLIVGAGDSILHILPVSGTPRESVLFLTVRPDNLLKHYEDLGLLRGLHVTANQEPFDAIGRLPENTKLLAKLRYIRGLDTAARYIKMSRGPIHVHWVQSPLPGNSQSVYFVIDGEQSVYELGGNVTRGFLDAVLAYLRVTAVP